MNLRNENSKLESEENQIKSQLKKNYEEIDERKGKIE